MALTKVTYSMIQGAAINVLDYGADPTGVNDSSSAIQAAVNVGKSVFIPSGTFKINSVVSLVADGQTVFGNGNDSVLKIGAITTSISTSGFDNVSFRNFQIDITDGDTGLTLAGGSDNISISDVYFFSGQKGVHVLACSNVKIQNCTFEYVLYGIIQQSGFVSSNVLIDGCLAYDMRGDFVLCNSENVKCFYWSIVNCVFGGSHSYPTPKTEERFVGLTEIEGVVISNNVVRNVAGDAAVHLEDTYGETIISNNIFDNCVSSGGNIGYVYLANSAEHVVIDGNIFLRTNATLPSANAVSTNSGSYANDIQFSNNRIFGNGESGNFAGLDYQFQTGKAIVSGNHFKNLTYAVSLLSAQNLIFNDNFISGCNIGVNANASSSATSSAGENISIIGNNFEIGSGTYSINAIGNSSGTGNPQKWLVSNNIFNKDVNINGDGVDNVFSSNVFRSTSTLAISGSQTRQVLFGNVFQNPAANVTSTAPGLPNYANDAAAAAGAIPIGGMYRNGSVIQVRVS
jgi:hypothetical protein